MTIYVSSIGTNQISLEIPTDLYHCNIGNSRQRSNDWLAA